MTKRFSFDRLSKITSNHKWVLPIIVYIIVAIVMSFSGYLYYQETKNIALDKTTAQLETLNNLKQEELIHWINERDKDVTFYRNNDAFVEEVYSFLNDPTKDKSILRRWLRQTQESHNYDIFIVDQDSSHYLIRGVDTLPLSGKIMSTAIESINTGKRIYIDIYRKARTDKLYYSSMAPLIRENDTLPFAALVFRSNLHDYFVNEIVNDQSQLLKVEYTLVKNDNDSVFYINNHPYKSLNQIFGNSKYDSDSPFVKALNGKQGVFTGSGIDNDEIIASSKTIPGSDWLLVVHTDLTEVEKPLTSRKWIITSYILLIFTLFILWYNTFVQRSKNKGLKEQLRLNHELINNRAVLQTIIQSSPLPLVVITQENKILIWNIAATQVFGWNFVDILKTENPIFGLSDMEEFAQIKKNVLNSGATYVHEMKRVSREGRKMDLRAWISELIDPFTKESNLLFILDDFTERKQIASELKSLNESLEQRVNERTLEVAQLNQSLMERASQLELLNTELESFTYSVSHDLKAPLRSIQGFTDIILLEHAQTLNEDVRRLISIVKKNAKRMDQLIRDLLDLSKVTRSTIKTRKLKMEEIINEIINNDFSQIRENTAITIKPLNEVEGDPVLIQQVWHNLLSNAVKYSRKVENPVIEIGSYSENGMLVYYVKDNGAGFNPEYAGKLFNTFQRLHTNDQFEGTGVGLAIVKRIILKHGGDVWAESQENEGATFYFSLPANNIFS